MILDHYIARSENDAALNPQSLPAPSFLEIGFGDNRKQFAGMHRFEVSHDTNSAGKRTGGATVCFSSLSCNPTVNKVPFPMWMFDFHTFYAQCLFRDGIREVLGE